MKRIVLSIFDWMSEHRMSARFFLAAVMILCLILIFRLDYKEDISAFLPQDEMGQRYASVYERLGGTGKIAFFFETNDKYSMSEEDRIGFLSECMSEFEEIWNTEDSLHIVGNFSAKVSRDAFAQVYGFVTENFPYFMTDEDYARADSLLSRPEYIDMRLQTIRQSMFLPSSAFVSAYYRIDPLDLFSPVLGRLSKLNPTSGSRVENGYLFTADGNTGIIFMDSPHGGSESGENASIAELAGRVTAQIERKHPDIRVFSTGGPLVAVENAVRIKKDSITAICLAMILISLLLFFSYKRFSDVFYIALSILCGAVFSLGVISIFKSEISLIALGIGSIIIGIAANYPLHFIDHLKFRPDKRTALSDQITPLLVGNITTVGAFLSLLFVKAEALRSFGFVGAMLLIGTIVFVLVFLPPLFPLAKRKRETINLDLAGRINLGKGTRSVIFASFVLLTLLFACFGNRADFDADLHNINYMTPEQTEGFSILSSMSSDTGAEKVYLALCGSDLPGDVSISEHVHDFVNDSISCFREVSLYDFLLSPEREELALARWNEFKSLHSSDFDVFSKSAVRNGFTQKAFVPFFAMLSKEYSVQDADFFKPLLLTAGSAMYMEDDETHLMVNYLYVDKENADAVKSSIRNRFGTSVLCFSDSDVSGRLVNALSEDFDKIGFLCSIIVFIFLCLSFGRLEISLIAFLPLALSWVWILGVMGIVGWKFNIVNIILATFIFGQGDDYTIFITEGLLYEYGTGKKILQSFRNSVTLSALLMFIGIGALIVAKHPAMKSLATVTMLGMSVVVAMACYLPPILFKLLVYKDGKRRKVPVTIRQLLRTLWMLLVFISAMVVLTIFTSVLFLFGGRSNRVKDFYHLIISKVSSLALKSIPGVKCSFSGSMPMAPSVIICNHQSHLDILALLALNPKVIVLTNEWVWKNPFYGFLVRMADFYPVTAGFDANTERLRHLVARGYSVAVFPEGTRSVDCGILRFHRGAVSLARALHLDIQTVLIHGFGYALPKSELLLRQADIYVEVGDRFELDRISEEDASLTRSLRHWYEQSYCRIRHNRETAEYCAWFVRARYYYLGREAVSECRATLAAESLTSVNHAYDGLEEVHINACGYGSYALLVALVHPEKKVYAYEEDEEKYCIACNLDTIPDNLHFVHGIYTCQK